MTFEELEKYCMRDDLHAVTYMLDGIGCGMAGWWLAGEGDTYREYHSKEDMLQAELPRIQAAYDRIINLDITLEP